MNKDKHPGFTNLGTNSQPMQSHLPSFCCFQPYRFHPTEEEAEPRFPTPWWELCPSGFNAEQSITTTEVSPPRHQLPGEDFSLGSLYGLRNWSFSVAGEFSICYHCPIWGAFWITLWRDSALHWWDREPKHQTPTIRLVLWCLNHDSAPCPCWSPRETQEASPISRAQLQFIPSATQVLRTVLEWLLWITNVHAACEDLFRFGLVVPGTLQSVLCASLAQISATVCYYFFSFDSWVKGASSDI